MGAGQHVGSRVALQRQPFAGTEDEFALAGAEPGAAAHLEPDREAALGRTQVAGAGHEAPACGRFGGGHLIASGHAPGHRHDRHRRAARGESGTGERRAGEGRAGESLAGEG